MDKRKGIILAIVLFLIIGLGTFVFAGGSDEGSGDGTITPQPDGGDDNDPTNPSDPTTEDDGNITEGEDKEDTTRPTGGNDNTDGDELVTDGEGENNPTTPTVDYKALLDELANMVETATNKEDLAEAEQFRKDNNITEENVAALDDDAASETYDEIIAILTDNASPVVTPDDLNGSFTNKDSVAVEITDTTDVSYTLTINGEEVTDADLANLTEEGNYELTVTDSAFNSTTITFTVDRTNPVFTGIQNGHQYQEVTLGLTEKNIAEIEIYNRDLDKYYEFEEGMVLDEDGTYTAVATDKAGNTTGTVYFEVDGTAPVIIINGEIVEPTDETLYYNETIVITVDEKNLASFTSNGSDRTSSVLADGWTAKGESGYKLVLTDKAGNETTYTVVIDKTEIEVNHLYVLNNSHNDSDYNLTDENRYKVIGNGQELYVEYVLKEEFTSTPVITIGGQEFEMNCGTASWNDSLYKCDAHITITEDMKLENGEVIPFTITGVKDIAGNETTVTEENVTVTEKYGQVIYDNEKPIYSSLGLVNITHYIEDSKGDNLFVANVGDTLRVMISFDELLEVNPTVTLGGVTKEMHFDDAWTDYSYWADIKITEDMNLTDGNIDFIISGYADAAGNVGVDLTSSDIKNSSYTGVELDTTAPAVAFANTHGQKYYNYEYITVTITEENLDEVYYTWGGSNKYSNATTLVPEELITDNEDGTYTVKVPTVEGRKKLSIKATDIAGNVYTGYSTSGWYNIDRTKPKITLYKWFADGNHQVVEPSVHNYCVIAEATDTNLSKITLNGNEYNNGELICGNGQYELIATDKAGLTKPINFEIDTEYGSVIINGDEYNTYDLDTIHKYNKIENMTFSEEGTVRLSLNDEVVYFGSTEEFNYTFVDGIYKVELFDKGGNPTVVMFELDSVAPQVVELRINSSNDDKGYANETHSVGIYLTVDEKLASDPVFTIDGKEYSKNQGDEDKNFYAVVTNLPETTTEGEIKFTIKVEDEFGNVDTFTNKDIKNDVGYDKVIFDTTAPEFDNLINNTEDFSVSLGVTDDAFAYILLKNETTGETIKEERYWTSFSEEGTWTAQVFDKAGNGSEVFTFTVKPLVASAIIDGQTVNFSSYTELFSAIPDNTETNITINKNSNEALVIPEKKIVNIDLNNKTVSGSNVITNNGIISEISNGTIESTNYGITNNGTITTINNVSINSDNKGIYNNGTINTVKDCEIEARFYPIHLVNNSNIALLENNEITGHYQSGIYVTNNASIGEIVSGYYTTYGDRPSTGSSIAGFALYIGSSAKVELISGGTFKGNKAAVANYGTIESITGGNFEEKYAGNDWAPSTTFLYDGYVNSVSGGKFFSYGDQNDIFDSRIDFTLTDGYGFVQIEDNYYEVQKNN